MGGSRSAPWVRPSPSWLTAILVAPLAIASDRPVVSAGALGLYHGRVADLSSAPGSLLCWIHGRPMPVCARCSGLYAGAALASPLCAHLGRASPPEAQGSVS